ncbi:lysozyme-like protein [Rhizoclosmatium globosum]|uniref:Lysozyme-like protein n=1 Tax=Rhizoclosmatium globosum TaxID=329046 RepID=A0A1Y2CBV7_9FUNG|nr:lysozyme-like protein [Rhizoclosmatium globosum]|eukprot:ORY44522.1 lysozyme-like protein [Rhizoclosmatium globosum]
MEAAISSICSEYYGSGTLLQRYWYGAGNSFTLPTGSVLDGKIAGLNAALAQFPGTLTTTDEKIAFVANILFESICLSTTEEVQCVKDPGNCKGIYGDNFWGRGYIQLTGRANYQGFADAVGRQDIMTNPGLVATDETLAWGSAVWFWKFNCGAASTVGTALKCVNSLECSSATSSVFFQFAAPYRLKYAQALTNALGGSDGTDQSISVCPQMGTSLDTAWSQFCQYHAGTPSASVTCNNAPPSPSGMALTSTAVDRVLTTSMVPLVPLVTTLDQGKTSPVTTAAAVTTDQGVKTLLTTTLLPTATSQPTSVAVFFFFFFFFFFFYDGISFGPDLSSVTDINSIKTMYSTRTVVGSGDATAIKNDSQQNGNSMSTGAIAGVSIAVVIAVVGITLGGIWYKKKRDVSSQKGDALNGRTDGFLAAT